MYSFKTKFYILGLEALVLPTAGELRPLFDVAAPVRTLTRREADPEECVAVTRFAAPETRSRIKPLYISASAV